MSILIIRININFRVFLSLYRQQFAGQYIMNPSKRRSRRSMRKAMKSKSQSIHQIRAIVAHQSSSLKNDETNEGEYITIWWCHGSEHEGTKVPDWSQKFEKFAADEVFSDSDETEEESEEDDNDIDYDQVPIPRKFKVIIWENNSSNMFYILNEMHLTESHHQMK